MFKTLLIVASLASVPALANENYSSDQINTTDKAFSSDVTNNEARVRFGIDLGGVGIRFGGRRGPRVYIGPHNHHHYHGRNVTCEAVNGRGRPFVMSGWGYNKAQFNAMEQCRWNSRRPESCHIVNCW